MTWITRKYMLASAACVVLALATGCERASSSLGRQIYVDGVGPDGRIAYTQGPDWLRFAGVGCVACHGERGQGMTVQANGVTGVAPAVTWAALAERSYDEATLRRALTEGVDPHGREFQYYMPRWGLSDDEFAALVAYLRTL